MDKYRKVIKDKTPEESIQENEVRVTQKGKVRNSISYVHTLFEVRMNIERASARERETYIYKEGPLACQDECTVSNYKQ